MLIRASVPLWLDYRVNERHKHTRHKLKINYIEVKQKKWPGLDRGRTDKPKAATLKSTNCYLVLESTYHFTAVLEVK